MAAPTGLFPKGPVLGWDYWAPVRQAVSPSVGDLPHRLYTTSGRAALYHALRELRLPPGAVVLVPTYHCPTMVSPVVEAGLTPRYYGLDRAGAPRLDGLEAGPGGRARAAIVSHYFGIPRSLSREAEWCQAYGVALIEDCAHSLFGMAGSRSVGHWGDYATASLTKFYPVPEAGLLASASRELTIGPVRPPGAVAELRALWDVVDLARRHGRLSGLSTLAGAASWLRHPGRSPEASADEPGEVDAATIVASSDMRRIEQRATMVARALHRWLPAARIVANRRRNYVALRDALRGASGAIVWQPDLPAGAAPYVLGVWIPDPELAEAVFRELRGRRMPAFRWDRPWPGTPNLADDLAVEWSRNMLQIPCHQDLTVEQMGLMGDAIRSALSQERKAVA